MPLGMTYIEILISLVLISMITLGMNTLQFYAMREAKTSYFTYIALKQINNMSERLHILKNNSSQKAIEQWNQQNRQLLPQGYGQVTGFYPHFILTIVWGKYRNLSCPKNKIGLSGCLTMSIRL